MSKVIAIANQKGGVAKTTSTVNLAAGLARCGKTNMTMLSLIAYQLILSILLHLHFISKDREKGGHILGLSIDKADLALDYTQGFEMKLPDNEMFENFDLTIDQSEDIKEVETDSLISIFHIKYNSRIS